jgi:hypothetical protein
MQVQCYAPANKNLKPCGAKMPVSQFKNMINHGKKALRAILNVKA